MKLRLGANIKNDLISIEERDELEVIAAMSRPKQSQESQSNP
jgi:hypothetical protein